MEARNGVERVTLTLVRGVAGYGSSVGGLVSATCLGLIGIEVSAGWNWLGWVVAGFLVIGISSAVVALISIFFGPSYFLLEKKRRELEIMADASEIVLKKVAYQCLKVTVPDHAERSRLTVYRMADSEKEFELICRATLLEAYSSYGRGRFGFNVGLIAEAWSAYEGIGCATNLPESKDEWIDESEILYGLPRDIAENISMRARNIAAIRMDRSTPESGNRSVIIVIELNQPDVIDFDYAHELRKHPAMEHLADVAGLKGLPSVLDSRDVRGPGERFVKWALEKLGKRE